jgi:predicted hydrocarbon binding protein
MKIILEDFLRYSAQPVLYRMGEEVGKKYADIFGDLTGEEKLKSALELLKELKGEEIRVRMEEGITATIKDGWEFKAYRKVQPRPSCHYTRGLLSGIISASMGTAGVVKEIKCRSANDEVCEFIFVER